MASALRKLLFRSTMASGVSAVYGHAALQSVCKQSQRTLTCFEHQGLQLLQDCGVSVPKHAVIDDLAALNDAIGDIGGDDFVVKALVKTGGRGLGVFDSGLKGGVQMVCSQDEAHDVAKKMLGFKLTTKQTGDQGVLCDRLLLAKRYFLRREHYFSITMERQYSGPVLIGCAQGGMSIEEIAKKDPDAVVCVPVDLETGITDAMLDSLVSKMGISTHCRQQAYDMFRKIFYLFLSKDCSLLEINPLAEDNAANLICMDCKMVVDDAAFYRQKELFQSNDGEEVSEQEVLAKKYNLNFIPLDGNIGCLVNGAGLAMATMDIIKLHGGQPANFLDVGGGASIEQVKAAFSIISQDAKVRAVLVNIFGGILRCDVIASGVCQAAKELKLNIPIVCRLMGTKVDDAKALIASSELKVLAVDNLDEAAKMSVKLASIMDMAREVALGVSFELPI